MMGGQTQEKQYQVTVQAKRAMTTVTSSLVKGIKIKNWAESK